MIVPAIAFLGVLFIASAAFAVCPAAPVVTTTADSGAGSLRQAIADACATDSITFDLGVSPQSIVVTTGELAIDKDLTIAGPGATLLTVDGNNASRVFHVLPNRTVTISDLTIANGMMNGDPSLLQIIGAGIFNEGTLTVARVTLRNNSAPDALQGAGGAIYSRAAFSDASLTIVDSTLSDNTAGISGGAVESGAIGGRTASLTIANSTFSGNSAGDSGCVNVEQAGGVAVATITNATITGNHATFLGLRVGGLRVGSGTTVVVRNSIIAGNVIDTTPAATAADVLGTLDPSSADNLVGDGSGMAGITNGSNGNQVGSAGSPIDPRLGPLADNGGPTFTHALLAGSPALDAGDNTLVVGFADQRGAPFERIVDAAAGDSTPTVDLGAFEADPSIEDVADKTAPEDTPLAFLFAADADAIFTSSSNTTLVPDSSIGVAGFGSTRTLIITPALNASGTTTVTVTATKWINGSPLSMGDSFVLTVQPVADPPVVVGATTVANVEATGLTVLPNPVDGPEVTYFRITNIINGSLFLNNGTPITDGQFIGVGQGVAGLRFTPSLDLVGTGSFQAQGATDAVGGGLGAPSTAIIAVNKHATQATITSQVANPSRRLDPILVSFAVTSTDGGPTPTGTVTVTASSGSETCTASLTAGSGECSISFDTGGVRTLTATYSGDALSLPGSGTASQDVSPCPVLPVVTSTADSGPGTLRQALADACAGEAITFDPALGSSVDLTSGELVVDKDLTIIGPGAKQLTVQRTSGNFRIFHVLPGVNAVIGDLTIANGRAAGDGGAILNEQGFLSLTGSTLRGNVALGNGGAIGSIAGAGSAGVEIFASTLSDNAASTGGAVFSGSTALGVAVALVVNSTLSGNVAQAEGSALELTNTQALISNATIAGNVATLAPGGAIAGSGSSITLRNSIVAGNRLATLPSVGQDAVTDADATGSFNNLIGDGTGMAALANGTNGNQVGTSAQPIDARLGPLADNGGPTFTHALLAGSPALDAGDNNYALNPTDQRGPGFVRVLDAAAGDSTPRVDIGAFEAVPSLEDIANKTTAENTPLSFAFDVANADTIAVTSSNTTLVPNAAANLDAVGSGSTRTLTIHPASGQSGTATITVTATKMVSGLPITMTDTFVLTVTPAPVTPPSQPSGSAPEIPTGVVPTPAAQAPGVPAGLAGSVSGSTVMLQWTAPTSGGVPTAYVVEAGTFTGLSDAAVFSTGNTATALSVEDVGAGTYFVRVRAQNAAGTSDSSNEVVVPVGAPPPPPNAPGAPRELVAGVNGSTVTLAWQPPTKESGSSPTWYQIEAGSSAGASDLSNFSTGSTATSITIPGVPAATYFVRARGANATGMGAPSNEVVVLVGGAASCSTIPAPTTGLAFGVNGSTVALSWNASAGATSYIVSAGSSPGSSDVTTTDTGTTAATAIATNVGPGTYFVRVNARNACGTGASSNEVSIVVSSR